MSPPAGCLAALVLVAWATSALGAQEPSTAARIDGIFAAYNERTPGCALGVVRNRELVVARGYGMANLEHAIPFTPRTVFRIGSTSKQFTAAAVLLAAHPLGMTDTHFHDDHAEIVSRRASGYAPDDAGGYDPDAVPLTKGRLLEYVGEYYSDELDAIYRIVTDRTTLALIVGNDLDGCAAVHRPRHVPSAVCHPPIRAGCDPACDRVSPRCGTRQEHRVQPPRSMSGDEGRSPP